MTVINIGTYTLENIQATVKVVRRRHSTIYRLRKGKARLDDIYGIQALAGGDWWDPIEEGGEDIMITKNITIIIQWKEA